MPRKERVREPLAELPSPEYLGRKQEAGWKIAAIEWERDAPAEAPGSWVEDIPYGLQVSPDCSRLVQNPAELEVVILALDMIVEDCPLSRVSEELNRRGHRTRQGDAWTPVAIFNLLPRMIQIGPKLFHSEEWTARRQRLPKVV